MSGRERSDRKRGSTENGAIKEAEFQGPNSSARDENSAKKPKIAMGFVRKPEYKSSQIVQKGIQMKLGSQSSIGGDAKRKPSAVAAAFNDDSDSEPEEMPPEAKMRMRNIGRETPTSAGPNSFGKTKQGFCDAKKVFEKNLKQAQDSLSGSKTKS